MRSTGFALAFAIFASALLGPAPVWSQSLLTFAVATNDSTNEGGDDVELRIGVPQSHVGSRVEMKLAVSGTAMAGSDYTLVAADQEQGITLGDGENSTITLVVDSAPAEPLRLLLRPRADDRISQGDRFLNLRLSRYLVPETGGTVDLPPALDLTIRDDEPPTVQQIQVGGSRQRQYFACVLLNGGSVRCGGDNTDGRATPPEDLGPVVQLGLGDLHSCAVTVGGQVRCWGSNGFNNQATPPNDLGPVAQLSVDLGHSCALTVLGRVRCWGYPGDPPDGRIMPPDDLGLVAQIGTGVFFSCALTVSGQVRCWGFNGDDRATPPVGLDKVVQLAVGTAHSCALTVSGEVGCWGANRYGQATVPDDLGEVAQLAVGEDHSCALTVGGGVRCWGSNSSGRATPPAGLEPVAQLSVGSAHSCAVTVSGQLRCWGYLIDVSSLPAGLVTTIDASGFCALLADGSVYCPGRAELIPPDLRAGDVVMLVLPRQLRPGQRAAIRFIDLRETGRALTARIEVFGEKDADVSSYYRLLDSSGQPLSAEPDGSYLLGGGSPNSPQLAGNSLAGNSLEALGDDRSSRLYVRPIELLSASGPAPTIRMVAQPIELIDGLFFAAPIDAPVEGGEEVQINIWLPLVHTGLQVEMELAVSGTAMAGSDYTLVAAPGPGIVLGGEANSTITLRVDSASAEPLRLLLRPRRDDRLSQGDRFLNLRISRYRVVSEVGGTTDLPPALNLTIRDDEPAVAQQVLVGRGFNRDYVCVLLNGGSVRCGGENRDGQATPPGDLGAVVQLAVAPAHSCVLTVSGRVRCWGDNGFGESSPPVDLGPVAQLAVGFGYSCAVTASGRVRCWGFDANGESTPPDDLGLVAQISVGDDHSCALTVSGGVRCWGFVGDPPDDRVMPPDDLGQVVQLAVGNDHSCALTVSGGVRCWGFPGDPPDDRVMPPDDLGQVVQLSVGDDHNCALTVSGGVRCWGANFYGQSVPPDNLELVAQISVGSRHSCAVTVSGQLRCWGAASVVLSLPPGLVTAIDASGFCALLAEGSVYCPDRPDLFLPELGLGDVVMSVLPRQLRPGERAAIRFTDLRETGGAFTARIEVVSDGSAEMGSDYRLLDGNGQPLVAGNSVLLTGNPPMAWLEALGNDRSSQLYVQLLELLPVSGPIPSIRKVVQPVELIDGLFLSASTDTRTEGGEEVQINIWLPLAHTGLQVEMELAVSGTALAGSDYTLVVADQEQGIILGSETTDDITLRVDSAPAEPLSLLLRLLGDDRISQGDRFLNLRISRYRVVPEIGRTVALPPALDLTIRDDEPLVVQQIQVGTGRDFSCVLLNSGSVRCGGANGYPDIFGELKEDGRATPPEDLGPVAQLAVSEAHTCALTVSGQVRCWGSNGFLNMFRELREDGRATPPVGLGTVVQLAVGEEYNCAVTVLGRVRCWGDLPQPPSDLGSDGALGRVVQLAVSLGYSCALTVSGHVRCWGDNLFGQITPPDDLGPDGALGPVAQIGGGSFHSCALTVSGHVRCWGHNGNDRSTPPVDLDKVVQLAVGSAHSCALTVSGRVDCWGRNHDDQARPPNDLGPVAQLSVGRNHSCVVTILGQLRCWGRFIDVSSLPPGLVTAIDASGICALLADGSVYCPDRPDLRPPELKSGDVVMSVWPRQLRPGERAAIRFTDLRETTAAFTARIEVFGEGEADVGSDYRLLDSNGQPLVAGNSGNSVLLTGNPPMAWLEPLADDRSSLLYVQPLELLPASGSPPSIRLVAQSVELIDGLFLSASTDALVEGVEEAQLSIFIPLTHTGLQVEMELAVSGTALAGSDYTLVAANPEQVIVLGGEANSTITLQVESVPAEPLRLLLRSRRDDRISQGDRSLNLRISRYRVVSEGGGTTGLPPALDLTIRDDEPAVAQQVLVGRALFDHNFACVLLNGGSVRCGGDNTNGQATPPGGLAPVTQLGAGFGYSCALTVLGQLRCWGNIGSTPGDYLGPFAQLAVGGGHSCAVTVSGEVRCWGGAGSPPEDLEPVAQLGVGRSHRCALTVGGRVRCWGSDSSGEITPPMDLGLVVQLAVGDFHTCALTVLGGVRCWGYQGEPPDNRAMPPEDLGPVAQIGVGHFHSCALTVLGGVRCWGSNYRGRSMPPDDLGTVAQIAVGADHTCALTVSGLRCWGSFIDVSSLPPGSVTAIDTSGLCALLADGSLYCPDHPEFVPPELRPSDVVMSVWPRQLRPGERAAIRFTNLRENTGAFTARIEVFGEGGADVGSDYRLLDSSGRSLPLEAEPDGSYLLVGRSPADPPMAWLEPLADDRSSLLYVQPLELLPASGLPPSIRLVAQSVELIDGLFLSASTDALVEGVGEAQLSIFMPLAHTGLQVEMELVVSGTALAGSDYTLVAANPERVTMVGDGANSAITLRVDSALAEPLRLLLRPRRDDRISQGDRSLNLRISRYRVVSEGGGTTGLPPALDLIIRDDEPPVAQRVLVGKGFNPNFACFLLNSGLVRCWGSNGFVSFFFGELIEDGRSTPPGGLDPVVQLDLGSDYGCVLTVLGQLRCWGNRDRDGRVTPPVDDLGPFAQLVVGSRHSCAVTISGEVRCWGRDSYDQATPPVDLGTVAQIALGLEHTCALTVSGEVRCWGRDSLDQATPPDDLERVAQFGVSDDYSCALTVLGRVRCWGSIPVLRGDRIIDMLPTPPDDLGQVAQLAVGRSHSCALTVSGRVRCWGRDDFGEATPPDDLGPVAQLAVGRSHSCALTVSGQVRCWSTEFDVSSLSPGQVTAIDASSFCILLAEGSVYCRYRSELVPPELRPGDVAMSVWPRQLLPGQRAAIRFGDLRETTEAFTARIEVFGDGEADVSSYYRLLDSNGVPLSAEPDGSYLLGGDPNSPNSPQLAGNSLAGHSLEALVGGQGQPLNLYVRPLEVVPAAGPVPSLRRVAQRVEIRNSVPFVGKLILKMHGGAKQLLLPSDVTLIPLQLSLADSDGSPLTEPTVLTVQLQGMVSGDAAVIPSEPFEITASDTVAGTADILVILGDSGETTLHFSASELATGAVADLVPTVLRVTRLSELLDLDVTEDERLGTEDVISLIRFVSAGRDDPLSLGAAQQARLKSLIPDDVVDLRLDLDGNGRMEAADFRILLRYLAGLRDSALGEGVRPEQVEALFQQEQ